MDARTHRDIVAGRNAIVDSRHRYHNGVDRFVERIVEMANAGDMTRAEAVSYLNNLAGWDGRVGDIVRRAAARLPPDGTGAMPW